MPELPDVENFMRTAAAKAEGRRIEGVESSFPRLLRDTSVKEIERALKGKVIGRPRRHGKHLFLTTRGGPSLDMHFGMSGYAQMLEKGDEPDQYSRFVLRLSGGARFTYNSLRMLGGIRLVKDPDTFIKEHGLGPDALTLGKDDFLHIYGNGRGAVKTALMDQSRVAGIGNYYSDEILFQSGIHPKTDLSLLGKEELGKLHQKMREVLQASVKAVANGERFPGSYLLPHRRKDRKCPRCGRKLQTAQIGGRTSYFCAFDQKEPSRKIKAKSEPARSRRLAAVG